MPLFLFSTHIQCIFSRLYTTALLCFPKNLMPWRDSNPGLLLRRMRCRLRHAAMLSLYSMQTIYHHIPWLDSISRPIVLSNQPLLLARQRHRYLGIDKSVCTLFLLLKLTHFNLAGFDLVTHSTSLLGGRRRRYH
jgi:hypothetical protein